ncbi:MAG: TlpA family protein disulfide reductase [Myxococcota bacterium]|nr:TlpA family protein disulfide reductase [Myxococcota bacterium]
MSTVRWLRVCGLPALATLVVSFAVPACGSSPGGTHADEAQQGGAIGASVPDLHLSAIHGGAPLSLSELRGKVFLLDVWASWCAPCKEELPMLDDMAVRLRSKGIEIVAVSIDDNKDDAEAFLQSRPSWSIRLAHDPEGQVPGKLQPPKMPSSYLVDRNGIIREMNAGFARSDAEKIESRLIALADGASGESKEKPASPPAEPSTEPASDSPPAPASAHSAVTAHGSIDGKPFAPKIARVTGRMQKDGRLVVSLSERTECVKAKDLKPGDATLSVLVPWKEGYSGDLALLKRSPKSAAVTFSRLGAKKNVVFTTFKPSGTVRIVSAPMEQGAVGKMKIDLASGDYTLTGELDVQMCVAPK